MDRVQIVDVFCGGGGFSTGAQTAGCTVKIAVDCWAPALAIHERNHATTAHFDIQCGEGEAGSVDSVAARIRAELDPALPVHLHCSPPCQQLTNANRINPDAEVGLHLVEWSVQLKNALRPDSFTLEQVNHPLLKRYLADQGLAFELVRMWQHGVPQGRKRIIATDPPIYPLPVMDPIPTMAEVVGLPPGLEHRSSNARLVKTCDGVGYTVTSLSTRVRQPGGAWRTLTFPEMLKFQTFPETYDLSVDCSNHDRRKVLGNAVPPRMAQVLMEQFQAAGVYQ